MSQVAHSRAAASRWVFARRMRSQTPSKASEASMVRLCAKRLCQPYEWRQPCHSLDLSSRAERSGPARCTCTAWETRVSSPLAPTFQFEEGEPRIGWDAYSMALRKQWKNLLQRQDVHAASAVVSGNASLSSPCCTRTGPEDGTSRFRARGHVQHNRATWFESTTRFHANPEGQ